MHCDRDGVFVVTPDGLKREFTTTHGRKIFELGGIVAISRMQYVRSVWYRHLPPTSLQQGG
jgi:hypothetical protein